MEFIVQVFSAGIISFLFSLLTEPRKERMRDFNNSLGKLSSEIKNTNNLAISYWSSEESLFELSMLILTSRTECIRQALLINRKLYKNYNYNHIIKLIDSYFKIITGGEFRSLHRKTDIKRLAETDEILKNILDNLDSSKISFTLKNQLLCKIN